MPAGRSTKPASTIDEALDSGEEWESVSTGMGEEFPIEEHDLVGNFLGTSHKMLTDDDGETRDQTVYQFAPLDDPEAVVFLWGSYQLDEAFREVPVGSKCKVHFVGIRRTTSKKRGPIQIKQYRIQIAKKAS